MDVRSVRRCMEQVAAYRASGLKAKTWAEANGVPLETLGTWYAHFRLARAGKTVVLCELGAQPGEAVWSMPDAQAIRLCCEKLAAFIPDVDQRLIGAEVMRQPLAYPVYACAYEAERREFELNGSGIEGLLSIGRNGEFEHLLMEDIYWRTIRKVDRLAVGLQMRPGPVQGTAPARTPLL